MRGRFITVEGIEGAGKSSNIAFISAWLEAQGVRLRITREPGDTPLGEAVRGLLLDPAYTGMAAETELLLMFAARNEHLRQVIEPALAAGEWVLCDRFTDASYAYQGGGRSLPPERIAQLESFVQGRLRPDATLILDVDVATGMGRARERSAPDRFEQEQAQFFDRVRAVYLDRAARYPERYWVINAGRPLDQVRESLQEVLSEWRNRFL